MIIDIIAFVVLCIFAGLAVHSHLESEREKEKREDRRRESRLRIFEAYSKIKDK